MEESLQTAAIHPAMLAKRIAALIERTRIGVSTEMSAHKGVFDMLVSNNFPAESEVWISEQERIDIMVQSVGIEVKVKGSKREIYRQLQRYAKRDQVRALVLATGVAWPTHIREIEGKPFFVASLTRGWL